jgi:hypothetical protein
MILLFAEDPAVIRWAEEEVDDKRTSFFVMSKLPELTWALTQDVPPRPQILVLDFDVLSPAALLELHAARERWFGAIIALGTVSEELKASLNIDYVLPRPLGSEALRKAIGQVGLDKLTAKIPKIKL